MTPNAAPACPHERGHGTSVCLRCRADAHAESTAHFQRSLAKWGIAAVVLGLILVTGGGALAARHAPPAEPANTSGTAVLASRSYRSVSAVTPPVVPASAPIVTKSVSPSDITALVPATGRTDLADSMYVMRAGDSVVVVFDTRLSRTRRRDKFEQVVRETLPAVLGTVGDSLLAAVPAGGLAAGGDLLTELPARGIRLATHDGGFVTLWPMTREGRDGPLVVSYRITVGPAR